MSGHGKPYPALPPILLLRHGHARWNAERRYLGWTDQPLLQDGAEQLAAARLYLQRRRLAGIHCSDLLRARQTLALVRPDAGEAPRYDKRLRELHFGGWEGLTYEELRHDPAYRLWLTDPELASPPGGESFAAFRGRVVSWLDELEGAVRLGELGSRLSHSLDAQERREEPPLLVVAHGGTIRMLATLLVPELAFWEIDIPTGGLLSLSAGNPPVQLV
ncbi:histidine phosphatase family protein [Paenibacillus sp. 1P07SE]|uniref:histidine phosphatase family protein n=1 Tax=Paenibacillus sp. 1P07SE TaxID=3132209 RepID=UPI0039A41CA8